MVLLLADLSIYLTNIASIITLTAGTEPPGSRLYNSVSAPQYLSEPLKCLPFSPGFLMLHYPLLL